MEEPERENIKLPFLQGCKTLCLTKTCTNCSHESLKVTHTILFTLQDTLERTVPFFSTLLKYNMYFMNTLHLDFACTADWSILWGCLC